MSPPDRVSWTRDGAFNQLEALSLTTLAETEG
jgi:hypothetical protein